MGFVVKWRPMSELRSQVLRRIFEDPALLSRNRNFHAYADSTVRRTARIGRLLHSLKQDLLEKRWVALSIRRGEDRNTPVVIVVHWSDRKRTSYLSDEELELLMEDRRIGRIIDRAS